MELELGLQMNCNTVLLVRGVQGWEIAIQAGGDSFPANTNQKEYGK